MVAKQLVNELDGRRLNAHSTKIHTHQQPLTQKRKHSIALGVA
jgi:hypothetical protein